MADIQEYSVSIKFKTEGADKSAKDADKVNESIGKLKSSAGKFEGLKTNLGKVAGTTSKVAKGIKVAAVAMGTGLIKAGKSASKYSKEMMDYIETVNLFRASMGDLADEAMQLVNRGEMELGLNPKSMMDAIASFQNLSEGFGITSDRAFIMSKNLAQLSGDLSSFANISYETAQKKLMSGFSGQVMPLRQYGIALDQASLQELAYSLGIEQRVKTMTRAQKTELIYYQIMKSTQKMQGDLGRTLMSPANALRVLQNEFKSLARAVGSIFIPIIQKIIPIMRAVTKALTQAARAIAAFFGFDIKDYTANIDSVGGGLEGIADDIGDVGGAAEGTAKKLNKMLMPFDELNNMNSPDSSGSGGSGGSGSGIGGGSLGIDLPEYDMFEFVDDRIQKFEDVLERARETAHRINELLAGIPWTEIKSTAGEIGKNVAEFLNIGITEIDWELVGTTFAEGLNTIIEAAYNFVTTFKWKEFGEAVGNLVNGFFENIDWEKAAETLNAGIKGTLDSIIEFLKTVEWEKIGTKIGDYLATLDYTGIAEKILEAVVNAFFALDGLSKGIANGILSSIIKSVTKGELDESQVKELTEKIRGTFEIALHGTGPTGRLYLLSKAVGADAMKGFFEGISQHQNEGKPLMESIYVSMVEQWGGFTVDLIKAYANATTWIVRLTAEMVNGIIDGINDIIDALNELGFEFDNLDYVDWADNYEKKMDEMVENAERNYAQITKTSKEETDKTKQNLQTSWGIIQENYEKNIGAMQTTTQESFGNMEQTAGIKTDAMKQAISKNLGESEQVTQIKTASILDKFSTTFENMKTKAQQNTSTIKNDTENNLGQIANSSVFSKIKDSFSRAFDNAQKAKELGRSTASNYEQALRDNVGTGYTYNDIVSRIKNIFNLGDSAYWWGRDLIEGFKKGIEATKNLLTNAVQGVANGISRFLHFSRPDEGPLREYETWFPDMIKGLSTSMLHAAPILNNAVGKVAGTVSESFKNIAMPNVDDTFSINQSTSQVINAISNRSNNSNSDETTANMIRATYEAVSRALIDNNSNDTRQPIIVNVGNKRVYEGYGKYQDEQSNMLGVNI